MATTQAQYDRFTKAVGRPPEQDDLERAFCVRAGEWPKHTSCGWCPICDIPYFMDVHHRAPERGRLADKATESAGRAKDDTPVYIRDVISSPFYTVFHLRPFPPTRPSEVEDALMNPDSPFQRDEQDRKIFENWMSAYFQPKNSPTSSLPESIAQDGSIAVSSEIPVVTPALRWKAFVRPDMTLREFVQEYGDAYVSPDPVDPAVETRLDSQRRPAQEVS